SVTLSATPSGGLPPYEFLWSNGETSQSITVSPTEATNFFVSVLSSGCDGNTDSVFVDVIDATDISCKVKKCKKGRRGKDDKTQMCEEKKDGFLATKCVKKKDVQKKLDSGKFTLGVCAVPDKVTMCHTNNKGPHEHCVKFKDVDKKLAKGDYTLGPCGIIPPISGGCECDGGIVELVVSHSSGAGEIITVNEGSVIDNLDGTYTITNSGKKLKASTELDDGVAIASVHTSCSKSIGVGDLFGDFTLVSFTDKNGNICAEGGHVKISKSIDLSQKTDLKSALTLQNGDNTLDVQIFPNPFNDQTNIVVNRADPGQEIEISIYDISGQKVYQSIHQTGELVQLGSQLYPGMSFVRVIKGNHIANLKIVKYDY
ncbi:MAG: T9SS type A sorting domain-containing protein, partial [Bacteroidetes bacterium]|nr:T9SS type A sorting domain-containing protein [Bacteroidota bacterium]